MKASAEFGPEANISRVGEASLPPIGRRTVTPGFQSPRRKGPSRIVRAVEAVTAVAVVATGAAIGIDKATTGHFPWETSNSAIITPGETPKPGETLTVPSSEPGQSLDVTFPPSGSPAPTETSGPTKSPEATPSPELSPLEQSLKDFLDGTTELPKDRFYENNHSKSQARVNIIDTGVTPYKQELTIVGFQGFLITEEVVGDHLVAYMGFEDGQKNRFYFPVNYGSTTNPDDKTILYRRGYLISNSTSRKEPVQYPTLEMKDQMEKWTGDYVYFNLDLVNSNYLTEVPDHPLRSVAEFKANYETSKALIEWTKKTIHGSYKDVPMPAAVKKFINKPVSKFNPQMPITIEFAPFETSLPQ